MVARVGGGSAGGGGCGVVVGGMRGEVRFLWIGWRFARVG